MAKGDILSHIKKGKLTIYVLSTCPYSLNALKLLQQFNVDRCKIVCDDIRYEEDKRKPLDERSQSLTFPKIFIGEESFGGNDALEEGIESGVFFQKLDAEGINYKKVETEEKKDCQIF